MYERIEFLFQNYLFNLAKEIYTLKAKIMKKKTERKVISVNWNQAKRKL